MRLRVVSTTFLLACMLFACSATSLAAVSPGTVSGAAPDQKPTANILVNIFDGTRKPLPQGTKVFIRVIDGNHKEVASGFFAGNSVRFVNLPVFDNFGDDYTVLVSASGYDDAGFYPVHVSRAKTNDVELMLTPHRAQYDFTDAQWDVLRRNKPEVFRIIAAGAGEDAARARLEHLQATYPAALACLLNIMTALDQVDLPSGQSPLAYYRELIWDSSMEEDRFFGYVDAALVAEISLAASEGRFEKIPGIGILHPGATNSWKQVQFGEANLHFTFHEGDTRKIGGVECVKLEIDIDYYRDKLAHTFLELIPNMVTGGLTNPKEVYQLRFIAERAQGMSFEPPYTLVANSGGKAEMRHKQRRTLRFILHPTDYSQKRRSDHGH